MNPSKHCLLYTSLSGKGGGGDRLHSVSVTSSEGLHLEQGGACGGSEVASQAKQD